MAKPEKKSETKITRIVASESSPKKVAKKTELNTKKVTTASRNNISAEPTAKRSNPFKRMGEYFKGSWYELRQVRWPDRRATWGMTGALIVFTAFFIILILLLDFGFTQLFTLITGK